MIVFKSTQDQVLSALQSVSGIVERRQTLPILANVMLRKTGASVQLTTSDLEIQIRTHAELGGDEGDFATTIAARKLIDILRTMPAGADGEIQLADAINVQASNNAVEAVILNGRRFDCGSVSGYLDAILHVAERRPR